MRYLGLDIGTKNIVLAYRGKRDKVEYISETNGYWVFERATPFIEAMLNASKKRTDGTERPARWVKLPDSNKLCVLGRDAEEFAYAKNDTLLRPMAEGGITPDEEAMVILSSIIHGILETAEKDLGTFTDDVKLCYCTTAPAINKELNIQYHQRVIELILSGYRGQTKLATSTIRESHAIVINESADATGIGVSWGAGTVTVSYVKYGIEIYSFCWVGAGDWIDEQVAMRHGYNRNALPTMYKAAKETPTTVAKRKLTVDLTPGILPADRIGIDITLHYDVLISQVIDGIIQGFIQHEAEARIEEAITVYMAGGTSSPVGFADRVRLKFEEKQPPFALAGVVRAEAPLLSVATGTLRAAEFGI